MTDPARITTATLLAMLRMLKATSRYVFDDYDRSVIAEIERRVMLPKHIKQADAPVICDTTRESEKPARILTRPDTAGMP